MGTTNLDALTCSGTVTAVNGVLTGAITVTGTITGKKLSVSGTATKGSRVIATGGSSTLTYSGIPAKTTPLLVTGRSGVANARVILMTQTAGAAKVGLFTGHGTAATGSVHWLVP